MALVETGIRLTASGSAEYRAQLNSVREATRLLADQSKLAMLQLDKNSTISQTYQTKMRAFGDSMKVAEQKTETLKNQQSKLSQVMEELPTKVETTNRAYRTSAQETERLENNYRQMSKALGENHKETQKAKEAWQKSAEETARLKTESSQLAKELSKTEKELAKLPSQITKSEIAQQRLTNEMQKAHDAYRNAGGRLADLANQYKDFGDSAQRAGDAMQNVGQNMTARFTVPIVAGYTAATKSASDFYSQVGSFGPLLAEGAPITAEITAEVERLGAESRKLAIGYGQDTSVINASMAELIRTGYTSNQVLGMMPNIMDATIASGEGMTEVMTTTSQVMSQFQLRGEDLNETLANSQRVTDSLTYVANATSAGFYDLGQGMSYVGPVANSLNMTVEETASILGILSDNGIEASQGGTALRGALTRLLKPSKQNAEAMAELGINAEDYKNGLLDFPTILDRIKENTKDLTDEQRSALIAQAFGTEAQSAMNALVNEGGDALREMTASAEGATGATKNMADEMKKLPEFKFKQAQAQLKDLGIEIGSHLLPMAVDLAEGLSKLVESFTDLDESTQQSIIKTGLFVAAIGPVLSILGKLASAVGKTSTGFGKLIQVFGKLTTPALVSGGAVGSVGTALAGALPIIGGAVAVISGLSLAYSVLSSDAFKAHRRMKEFPDISDLTAGQAESLRRVADEVSGIKTNIDLLDDVTNFDTLNESVSGLADEISSLNQQEIEDLRESFSTLPTDVQESLSSALEATIATIEEQSQRAQEVAQEITDITKKGLDEDGVLRKEYAQQVKALTDELYSYYAESLAENGEQAKEIYNSLNKDITSMTLKELDTRLEHVRTMKDQEIALYEQQQNALWEMYKSGAISKQEHDSTLEGLQRAHVSRMTAIDKEYIRTSLQAWKELNKSKFGSEEYNREYQIQLEGLARQFGLTMEEIEAIANSTDLTEPVKNMATAFEESSPKLKTAVNEWNDALLNFADQVGKNIEELNNQDLQEFVNNIEQTGMSWADLELIAKEAEIEDNVREFIENYVEAQGGWEKLKLEEKEAKLTTSGEEELQRIIELFGRDWATLSDEEKQALVETNGTKELSDLLVEWGLWHKQADLAPKHAVIETDEAKGKVKPILEDLNLWNNVDFLDKFVDIDTNAPDAQQKIAELVAEWSGLSYEEALELVVQASTEEAVHKIGGVEEVAAGMSAKEYIMNVSADVDDVMVQFGLTREEAERLVAKTRNVKLGVSGAENTKEELQGVANKLSEIPESKSTGVSATLGGFLGSLGLALAGTQISNYSDKVNELPEEKSSTVNADTSSISTAKTDIQEFNSATDTMKNKSTTVTTSTPGMNENSKRITQYNTTAGKMKDTKSTATTDAPGIVKRTKDVSNWNNTSSKMKNKTSTATTRTPNISTNIRQANNWISALNRSYNKTSTLTTIRRTINETVSRGGGLDQFARGGQIAMGGGLSPYTAIVGEAGPELFQVSRSGVRITPLNAHERSQGISGVLNEFVNNHKTEPDINVHINIDGPVVREEQDITALTKEMTKVLEKELGRMIYDRNRGYKYG